MDRFSSNFVQEVQDIKKYGSGLGLKMDGFCQISRE